MQKYTDVIFVEKFDIVPGMWLWVLEGSRVYGGILKEGKDNLYIRDETHRHC
jgi:hypothetical protein